MYEFAHIEPKVLADPLIPQRREDCKHLTIIFMVLKVAPLVVTESQAREFVDAARSVIDLMHRSNEFWNESLAWRAV